MFAHYIYYLKRSRLFLSHIKSRTCLLFQLCWNGIYVQKYIFRKHFAAIGTENHQNGFVQFLFKCIQLLSESICFFIKHTQVAAKLKFVHIKEHVVGAKLQYVFKKERVVRAKLKYVFLKEHVVGAKLKYVFIKEHVVKEKLHVVGAKLKYVFIKEHVIRFLNTLINVWQEDFNLSLVEINGKASIKRYFQKHIKRKGLLSVK